MPNNKLPILYSFRRCPYAIRARMVINYTKFLVEIREIELRNKPRALIEASSKATVPVLIVNSESSTNEDSLNECIDESLQIMQWALAKNDPQSWFVGLDHQQQAEISILI